LVASRGRRVAVLATLTTLVVLGGGWLWFRDSSLVSVTRVTVTGENGPDAGAIRSALKASARSMTTLDVQTGRLYAAVSAFPVVESLRVTTQFPHGMCIRVIEQLPVAEVVLGGRRIAVASDGTLLHDLASLPALPKLALGVAPGGPRLAERRALEALAAARAAPHLLSSRIAWISLVPGRGLVARMRSGPAVYLGDASRLAAKWAAAVAVLDDPGSAGAAYIDVTDPRRPAAGASPPPTADGANH
jgi:cell division septal protein FtsQ